MVAGKTWNRRLALAGGAALAAGGGYLGLRQPSSGTRHRIADATTLHRGNMAEPETLDPNLSTGTQDDAIMGDLMMGLMTEDPMCQPIPGMNSKAVRPEESTVISFAFPVASILPNCKEMRSRGSVATASPKAGVAA